MIRDDRDLRAARAQLQMTDRLAAMGTIAAGVAHEINNPLAFVISNLEFLIEELGTEATSVFGEDGEEIMAALAAAHRGSERVRQIVQDLRTFSRADRDSVRPVDVNQLIHTTLAMLDNEIRHHAGVVLELGEIPEVEANEAKLGQVFLNLVHNATQAIAPGRVSENTIRITSSTDARGNVVVTVQDTGQGIEPRNMDRIFDAFFTTKPVGVGTGLGLSICHQVVTQLGGSIHVESEVGKGATFTVTLPPSQLPSTASDVAAPETTSTVRRRVLVIDDEIEVGQAVRRILRRHHDVDAVRRADVALQLLSTTRFLLPDDSVKVADFGVARVQVEAVEAGVAEGVSGTAWYMSPEQASGRAVDSRSDLYALGVVMFEMLTGRVPFDGARVVEVLSAHLTRPLSPMVGPAGLVAAPVQAVVRRALEKNPDDRFQTPAEMMRALEQARLALETGP